MNPLVPAVILTYSVGDPVSSHKIFDKNIKLCRPGLDEPIITTLCIQLNASPQNNIWSNEHFLLLLITASTMLKDIAFVRIVTLSQEGSVSSFSDMTYY